MIETGAMPSALFGDFVTLTIGKTVDWKYFFINKGGFFTIKSRLLKEEQKKSRLLAYY
jgi:hypothetical protein